MTKLYPHEALHLEFGTQNQGQYKGWAKRTLALSTVLICVKRVRWEHRMILLVSVQISYFHFVPPIISPLQPPPSFLPVQSCNKLDAPYTDLPAHLLIHLIPSIFLMISALRSHKYAPQTSPQPPNLSPGQATGTQSQLVLSRNSPVTIIHLAHD